MIEIIEIILFFTFIIGVIIYLREYNKSLDIWIEWERDLLKKRHEDMERLIKKK